MISRRIPERTRRVSAMVLQWSAWAYAISIFAYATAEYNPSRGQFAPQWVGFSFILSIGLAVAGTLVRSRMRLTDTIIHVFQAGVESERDRKRK